METFIMITKMVGILVLFYIGMNRLLHYIDGDYKNKRK
jgi:hypothetical protein